jgi:hypothetical protein
VGCDYGSGSCVALAESSVDVAVSSDRHTDLFHRSRHGPNSADRCTLACGQAASVHASVRRHGHQRDHVSAIAIETVSETATATVRKIVTRSARMSVIATGSRFCLWRLG